MDAARGHRGRSVAVVVIVLAQWFGTSLWLSTSGAADGVSAWLGANPAEFGMLIAATQIGFILGTLISAASGLADRFAPEWIFVVSSLIGAVLNVTWTLGPAEFALVWISRCAVGVALAGIYPMGMKMIVKRSAARSGQTLGWLVGMLTLGTAMPQFLRAIGAALPWESIMWGSSGLAVLGALLVSGLIVPPRRDGPPEGSPPRPSAGPRTSERSQSPSALRRLGADRGYRSAVLGYLGHMWELYAFWAVVPGLVGLAVVDPGTGADSAGATGGAAVVSLLSFLVIGLGVLGCVLGGTLSLRIGSAPVAASALAGSGLMCLIYPLLPPSPALLIAVLGLWGFFVVADSPQFSALAARHAPPELTGIGLTAMNSAGFTISVLSIVALQGLIAVLGVSAVWLLLPGPVLGLLAMRPLLARSPSPARRP